jgi:bifunctional DNase/RNase
MEKIQLVVQGLSASPANNNAYALILKEIEGSRRLPIIIGAFEAQAIALEMEGVVPPRPMTHDLMKTIIDAIGSNLSEIFINELKDGTFYAKLIFEDMGLELDARPSDAIALAVRCNSPIYVNSEVLDETGIIPQAEESVMDEDEDNLKFMNKPKEAPIPVQSKPKTRIEQLQMYLDKAVQDEDYERAASLRDEIKRILESS